MELQPIQKGEPTLSGVHIDEALTNVSVAYMTDESTYVARQVFPEVKVKNQTDKYWVFNKEDWFRDEAEKRADNTETAGSGYRVSTDSYYCDVWGFHRDLGSQLRSNADTVLRLETNAARFVTQRLLLRQEIQWTTDFFTTSKWGTDTTVANQWSDYTSSDPIMDIENGKEAILSVTGMEPNTLVLGYQVFKYLKHHPDIRDRIKYVSAENVTTTLLARLFEVDRVLVTKGIKATNVKGATAAFSFIQGKHALLVHSATSPAPETPSGGYTFVWDQVGSGGGLAIDAFDIRRTKTRRVEGEMSFSNKIIAADLGVFFPSVVA